MSNMRKAIAYAQPTSHRATQMSRSGQGCWFVRQDRETPDGEWISDVAPNAKGYLSPVDPDLITAFIASAGDICPYFMEHMRDDHRRLLSAQLPQIAQKEDKILPGREWTFTEVFQQLEYCNYKTANTGSTLERNDAYLWLKEHLTEECDKCHGKGRYVYAAMSEECTQCGGLGRLNSGESK